MFNGVDNILTFYIIFDKTQKTKKKKKKEAEFLEIKLVT